MSVQLLISFDTTGSMYPCIKQLKYTLQQLLDYLYDVIPNLQIGIISHGDYCDYSYPPKLDWIPFTDNKMLLSNYVVSRAGTSGGDGDEFYEWIFQQVTQLDWNTEATKIYIPIGDANCHEVGYRWDGNTTNIDWKHEISNLVSAGVNIVPIQCLPTKYDTEANQFWKNLATYSLSPLITLDQFKDAYQIITAIALSGTKNTIAAEQYVNALHEDKTLNVNVLNAFKQLNPTSDLIGGLVLEDRSVTFYKQNTLSKSRIATGELEPVEEGRFQIMSVRNDCAIKAFVEEESLKFKIGRGFYQLSKAELIQENKEVVLRDSIGNLYTGAHAREMIHAPWGTRTKVYRHSIPHGWTVFIQSTSSNRKLLKNTEFLYEV